MPLKALSIALFATVSAMADSDSFIDGFPDVPLLPGLNENPDDRTVFDTPSGTVAETTLLADRPAAAVIDDYSSDLPVLGWACDRDGRTLSCRRENDKLVFFDANPGENRGIIVLRLEPVA
ncbi:MAG: hypothetical protein EP335_15565 [Alphaproteobacteria bacterium]|nr:MAG: hypothetical protein EP335_15565 [Alphaproteobacteria bacterium]